MSDLDLSPFQGTWRFISARSDHRHLKFSEDLRLVFDGDMLYHRQEGLTLHSWQFQVNNEFHPKQFDWIVRNRVVPGTYQFDGEKLIICLAQRKNHPRPETANLNEHGFGWELMRDREN